MQYKCDKCNDTGSCDKSGDYLDCGHCDAAMQRAAMNDFLDKLPAMGDYDAAWLVHQRALDMAPKQKADHINDVVKMVSPPGWKLVPVEPTDEMRAACRTLNYQEEIDAEWKSMLAAAPATHEAYFHNPEAASGALIGERKLFEKWAEENYCNQYAFPRGPGGESYENQIVQAYWKAWQARAILAAAGPDAALVALIHKAQIIPARHLPPGGPDSKTTISELLGLLDGPESRAAISGAKGN